MRIAVIGAGAVGGYFGARLVQAGRDVTFIARGATLEALRDRGLRLESVLGDLELGKVTATDKMSVLEKTDLVIVATKAHQLPDIAGPMSVVLAEHAVVLPLQNGIQSYDLLSSMLGLHRLVHGFCRILSSVVAPGHVRHSGAEPTILYGEATGGDSSRSATILKAFDGVPGITLEMPADIRRALWEKFLFVAAFGTVGALVRQPVGVLRSVPETRRVIEASMREIVSVGRAHGVALTLDAAARGLADIDGLPALAMASMQRDLLAGRPSELIGQIAPLLKLAEVHSIPTPVNSTLYAALLPAELEARGELPNDR